MDTSLAVPIPESSTQLVIADPVRTAHLLAPLVSSSYADEPGGLISFALAYAERFRDDIPQLELASDVLLTALTQAHAREDAQSTILLADGLLPICGRLSILDHAEHIIGMGIEASEWMSDQRYLARFQNRLGGLLYLRGSYHEGWQLWHNSLRAATAMGLYPGVWEPMAGFIYVVEVACRSDEAGAVLSTWEAEDPTGFPVVLFARGFNARILGRAQQARDDFTRCLALLAEQYPCPTGQLQLFRMAVQAELARAQGEVTRAGKATEAALNLATVYGDFYTAIALCIDHGIYCWRYGHPDAARATAAQLTSMLDEAPESPWLTQMRRQVACFEAKVTHRALPAPGERLSDRELNVLRLVAQGYSNNEVADQLIVSATTVKKHLEHIYSKLDVHNRTAAVARAKALLLIP